VTENRSGALAARRWAVSILFVAAISSFPRRAAAEKVLATVDNWQLYTDGRVGAFVSWAVGDGFPQPTYGVDAMGNFVRTPIAAPQEGGFRAVSEQNKDNSLNPPADVTVLDQGTINIMRLRSGFISNVFGFGVRGPLTPDVSVTSYIQIWAFVENDGRQKNLPNFADVRQGYVKVDAPWGTVTVGRTRALFSRGATDIDVMYAHRWGVGWPGNLDNRGPTLGQLGFGVLGSGFSSAAIYGTPVLGGFKLDVGIFDPVQLQGQGGWTRTKYVRPEAELTFEQPLGNWGKVVLFANGAYQKVYKDSYCTPILDPETNNFLPCDQTVAGAGYGGRLEVGPFHLGVAGHYGQGLGLNYALEVSDAAQDKQGNLRRIGGWYVQSQLAFQDFDVFAGWGIVQIYLTDYDNKHTVQDPRDPTNPNARVFPFGVLKSRMGINAGVVYHVSPALHLDLDFFRAEADWYPVNNYAGQKQVVWVSNAGMMYNW
jgi:hypothetical protein